jgi:hypothetical protein
VVGAESEVGSAVTAAGVLKMAQALTPSEKQKAYRQRLKDNPEAYRAYKEANKLRMRKKRDGL